MLKQSIGHKSRRPVLSHPPIPHEVIPPLGIAGNIARFFIDSPLSPLLLIASLLIGLIGLLETPRQEDPQISVPMIDIFLHYTGASAEQVANLAISPLERILSEIPGVKHVYSAAERGQGMVTVRFEVSEDWGKSIVKVHDKLQSNRDKIPTGVSMPLVKPKGIDDVPVVTLTLSAKNSFDYELHTLAQQVLQRLKQVPNTGLAFIVGGRTHQVRIEPLPQHLTSFGISLDQIAQTIASANKEQTGGHLENLDHVFNVSTGSFLRNGKDVENLVIGVKNGSPVYVRDVAKVIDGASEFRQMVTHYDMQNARHSEGKTAVTLAIAKKEGSNGVDVAHAILAKMDTLKGRLIPSEIEVTVTRNYGKTANDKVNELLEALVVAALVVSFLCWITMGLRPAIVVITVIPVVILITIWATWMFGYTVNRVSLFALIFAIGILVDDATVVVENIFRRWLREDNTRIDTAIDAVREVGNPTIIATLTILSALLPMGFVSGMMGPYMLPIPVLGSLAMAFSLVAAFVFTPWTSMRLKPQLATLKKAEEREMKAQQAVGRYYQPIINPLIRSRKAGISLIFIIIFAFFAACFLFYNQTVTVKMLPFDNKPEFNVLQDKNQRERNSHEIATVARHLLTPLAQKYGANIAVVEMPPGPPVLQTMVAEVYGPDAATRRQVAQDLTQIFNHTPNLVDADNYMISPFDRWQFAVDTEKAIRLGVSIETINRNVLMAMGGYPLGDVKRDNTLEPVPLVLRMPLEIRGQIERIHNVPVSTPTGQTVPLAELGRFIKVAEEPIIYHKDLRPMEYVVGEMEGKLDSLHYYLHFAKLTQPVQFVMLNS